MLEHRLKYTIEATIIAFLAFNALISYFQLERLRVPPAAVYKNTEDIKQILDVLEEKVSADRWHRSDMRQLRDGLQEELRTKVDSSINVPEVD